MTGPLALVLTVAAYTLLPAALLAVAVVYATNPREGERVGRKG